MRMIGFRRESRNSAKRGARAAWGARASQQLGVSGRRHTGHRPRRPPSTPAVRQDRPRAIGPP